MEKFRTAIWPLLWYHTRSCVECAQPCTSKHNQASLRPADDHILVYSLPKSGTSTLQRSLGALLKPPTRMNVVTEHTWKGKVHRAMKTHTEWISKRKVDSMRKGQRLWVISSVRLPFTRWPSWFFENQVLRGDKEKILHMSEQELERWFRTKKQGYRERQWVGGALARVTGVNFTKYGYDGLKQCGNILYERATTANGAFLEAILVREEDAAEWPHLLSTFFPNYATKSSRLGESAWYKDVYSRFKASCKYTAADVEQIHQEDALLLYSADEVKRVEASMLEHDAAHGHAALGAGFAEPPPSSTPLASARSHPPQPSAETPSTVQENTSASSGQEAKSDASTTNMDDAFTSSDLAIAFHNIGFAELIYMLIGSTCGTVAVAVVARLCCIRGQSVDAGFDRLCNRLCIAVKLHLGKEPPSGPEANDEELDPICLGAETERD